MAGTRIPRRAAPQRARGGQAAGRAAPRLRADGPVLGPLAPALARRHTVVRLDAPGHGGSGGDAVDLPATAGLIAAAGGPAVYLGYSMGGRIQVAVDRPDVVHAGRAGRHAGHRGRRRAGRAPRRGPGAGAAHPGRGRARLRRPLARPADVRGAAARRPLRGRAPAATGPRAWPPAWSGPAPAPRPRCGTGSPPSPSRSWWWRARTMTATPPSPPARRRPSAPTPPPRWSRRGPQRPPGAAPGVHRPGAAAGGPREWVSSRLGSRSRARRRTAHRRPAAPGRWPPAPG